MRYKKHRRARLCQYGRPIFPKSIALLRRELDRHTGVSVMLLDHTALKVEGFTYNQSNMATSDGYRWFYRMNVTRNGCDVSILVPHATDYARRDGTQADRSIAVYLRRRIPRAKAMVVAEGVVLDWVVELALERRQSPPVMHPDDRQRQNGPPCERCDIKMSQVGNAWVCESCGSTKFPDAPPPEAEPALL